MPRLYRLCIKADGYALGSQQLAFTFSDSAKIVLYLLAKSFAEGAMFMNINKREYKQSAVWIESSFVCCSLWQDLPASYEAPRATEGAEGVL